ncbi:MAG: hypothetical protein L3J24_01850 [Xanthomonadales bacterium]|nr:hypothetical protein [Xanthomonadales bacterium]
MMKYSTLVSSSVLVLLLATFTLSAQALDQAEMEMNQQKMDQQMLEVSDWFQDQGYLRSNLMLAVTGLSIHKRPSVDRVLEILNAGIGSKQLQKSDWHRLARFCQEAHLKTAFIKQESTENESANQLVNWCKKNRIVNQFIKKDADNAYAYLFQMDFSADDPYNRDNQRLLEKAASAKYVTDYFGYGMQAYTTHLREYYRSHQLEPIVVPAGFGFSGNVEDMFAYHFLIITVAVYVAYPMNAISYCTNTQRQLWPSFDDKTVLECIRLMELFRSDKNTVMDNRIANAIIASLSTPGSDQQLEATRLEISNRLAYECLATWGDPTNSEVSEMVQFAVFLKMTQLRESMGEMQAMAVASDQYFAERQNKNAPKPSSCLLLKDLSLEAAEELLAAKK